MSFLDWIEKQQNKPSEARKKVALFTTVLFTSILGIIWLSTTTFFGSGTPGAEYEEYSPASFFKSLKDSTSEAGEIFDQLKDSADQLGEYTDMLAGGLGGENVATSTATTTPEEELSEEEILNRQWELFLGTEASPSVSSTSDKYIY